MKVKLHSISDTDGLEVEFTLQPSDIIQNSKNSPRVDETILTPVVCSAHLAHSEEDVFLNFKTQVSMECICYRCGDSFTNSLPVNAFLTCAPRTRSLKRGKFGSKDSEMEQDSDEGLVYFDREEIDLAEIAKEQILLALPMRYLCKSDCAGVVQTA